MLTCLPALQMLTPGVTATPQDSKQGSKPAL